MPERARDYVLDTVALRVMAFAHPNGVAILLAALAAPAGEYTQARFPAEVYDRDEAARPLDTGDEDLSELARGLRFAGRRANTLPLSRAQRYRTWLENAAQLVHHLQDGSLLVDPLTAEELPRREELRRVHGLGRGEAACLVLAERGRATGVFLSSDEPACRMACSLGLAYLTLAQVLEAWVERRHPTAEVFDVLVGGMRAARFGLAEEFVRALKRRL